MAFETEAALNKKSGGVPMLDSPATLPANYEDAWNHRSGPDLYALPGSDLARAKVGDTTVSIGTKFSSSTEERVVHPGDNVRGAGVFGLIGISFK